MPYTKQQIIARHPESFSLPVNEQQVSVEVCERTLLDIKGVLDSANIPFWLWAGTFLGIYRDGTIMPWDRDIDLAVYDEDIEKIASCEEMFADKGFELSLDYWRGRKNLMLYRDGEQVQFPGFRLSTIPFFKLKRSETYIKFLNELGKLLEKHHFIFAFVKSSPPIISFQEKDTFVCDQLAEGIKISSLQLTPSGARTQAYYVIDTVAFETPCQVQFLGEGFRILADPERWLEYIYGPSWRIPDKDPGAGKRQGQKPLVQREMCEVLLTEEANKDLYRFVSSRCPSELFTLGGFMPGNAEDEPIALYPDAEALLLEYLRQRDVEIPKG